MVTAAHFVTYVFFPPRPSDVDEDGASEAFDGFPSHAFEFPDVLVPSLKSRGREWQNSLLDEGRCDAMR